MRVFLVLMSLSFLQAELPPKGITVSQWVREDYFSTYLGGDLSGLERGEAKAKELLATDETNDSARAWLAGGQLFVAGRAYKAGDVNEGNRRFDEAMGQASRALMKQDGSAVRILGASYILMADRFPESQRLQLLKDGRDLFALIRKQEDAGLDQLPLHFKAEVLAGQAQAAMRLGLRDEATKYLKEIVAKLPDTHYSQTAEKWLANPASASKSQLVCQSCHEPNRLANRLKAIAAN
jgi:tetratricopeptide (TPR) repeat protein